MGGSLARRIFKDVKSIFSLIIKKILLILYNYINNNDISLFAECSYKLSISNRNIIIKNGTVSTSSLKIGDFSYIGYNCFLSADLGRYCSVGNSVSIGPGEHPLNYPSTNSIFFQPSDDLCKEDCVIENDVWIGTGAVILRGVRLGNGCVIGASAVVTSDVEPYSIVAGVPAKFIRYRFSREKISMLLESEWWQFDPHEAKKRLQAIDKK